MLRENDADVCSHSMDDSVFATVEDTMAASFGASLKTGGAAWKSPLVGMGTRTGERIEGDAVIDVDDFARPDVDGALTPHRGCPSRTRADLQWEGSIVENWAEPVSRSVHGDVVASHESCETL